jgi:hypothetical protein
MQATAYEPSRLLIEVNTRCHSSKSRDKITIGQFGFCGVNIADAYDKPMRNRYLRASLVLKTQSLFVVKLFHAVNVVFTG